MVNKTLLRLAEYIDLVRADYSIYFVESKEFKKLMDYKDKGILFNSLTIDQQIYFVLLVNEATK